MGEHYLSVRKRELEFQAAKAMVTSLATWIRLPELPIKFFHLEILRSIGNGIRRFIRIDAITNTIARGWFARLCVQLDMNKPLWHHITIGSFTQPIQYENLPNLCYAYGRIGHVKDGCTYSNQDIRVHTNGEAEIASSEAAMNPPADFGPWMVVTRKHVSHRNENKTKVGRLTKVAANITYYSDFTIMNSTLAIRDQDPPSALAAPVDHLASPEPATA